MSKSEIWSQVSEMGVHYHEDDRGYLHRCFHYCRNIIFTWQFWLGMTLSFPFEHYLWLHVYPLSIVGHFIMGDG